MFSRLEKPRVRYDVEVVAKLVVYCGWSIWDALLAQVWVSDYVQRLSPGSPLKGTPFCLSTLDLGSDSRGRPDEASHPIVIDRPYIHSLPSSLRCLFYTSG